MLRRLGSKAVQAALSPFGLRLRRVPVTVGYTGPALATRHVENCVVLPDRHELLRRLPSRGVVCELGVADGDFSSAILSLARPERLHLVDTWDSPRYAAGCERVQERFRQEIADGRVVVHRGRSIDALAEYPDAYFDWVYIDTDHTYETTLAELGRCARKVKPIGHIAGHDFSGGNPANGVHYGVIPACHRFCAEQGWQLEFITVEYAAMFSFCLRRL